MNKKINKKPISHRDVEHHKLEIYLKNINNDIRRWAKEIANKSAKEKERIAGKIFIGLIQQAKTKKDKDDLLKLMILSSQLTMHETTAEWEKMHDILSIAYIHLQQLYTYIQNIQKTEGGEDFGTAAEN